MSPANGRPIVMENIVVGYILEGEPLAQFLLTPYQVVVETVEEIRTLQW